ncbi:unnamed protein product [Protopolystoma xenopodis]|uniref:Uncharacterized protein n=1 Tax=Protopolystoma xenopodis TaxID=117903 RepID=A0A448WUQ9_9PLAT|nr:unnamed protein product [Protopolystoma xenopodis]
MSLRRGKWPIVRPESGHQNKIMLKDVKSDQTNNFCNQNLWTFRRERLTKVKQNRTTRGVADQIVRLASSPATSSESFVCLFDEEDRIPSRGDLRFRMLGGNIQRLALVPLSHETQGISDLGLLVHISVHPF